jgi:dihydroorotate dehydrogenase electron transfer subunit
MLECRNGRLEALASRLPATGPDTHAIIEGSPLEPPSGDAIILAQGLGLAPLIHLCALLRASPPGRLLALYEPPAPAPFRPRPSRFLVENMPAGVIAAIPLLEDWGIPSRLASVDDLPGAFEGGAEALLAALPLAEQTTVFAFGDTHFLARVRAYGARLGQILRTG